MSIELRPGSILREYELVRELGRGGSNAVWLARDKELGREVALKLLSGWQVGDPLALKRFLREAGVAAGLSHPNTVTVHAIDSIDDLIYIDMEYVPGGSLDGELEKSGNRSWRNASKAIVDAAHGLAAAHEIGIVHRDLKPSNLLRDKYGNVKIGDFGIARLQQETTQLTQTGAIIGTPTYMSPEQCRGETATTASDIYSLTCCYYSLLTGQRPFLADDLPGLIHQHLTTPLPDPRLLVADIPAGICSVLVKGSQKRPEDRYQSAEEFAADVSIVIADPDTPIAYDGLPDDASNDYPSEYSSEPDDLPELPEAPRGGAFATIRITISQAREGEYSVLMEAPGTSHAGLFSSADQEFQEFLETIKTDRASASLLSEFGQRLFEKLLPGDFGTTYAVCAAAGQTRIQLRLFGTELHDIPWELLFSAREGKFLGVDTRRPISRTVDARVPVHARAPGDLPLRVYVCIADPVDLPDVAATREVSAITSALTDLMDKDEIDLVMERNVSRASLTRSLQLHKPHVFHFIGHGHIRGTVGGLSVEHSGGSSHFLDSETLTDILQSVGSIRLAVLNACDSHVVAHRLAMEGIAAIGMLYKIRPAAAAHMARSLYHALAQDIDVDVAVNYSRETARRKGDIDRIDWCAPVVYLPGGISRLFNFSDRDKPHEEAMRIPEERKTAVALATPWLSTGRAAILTGIVLVVLTIAWLSSGRLFDETPVNENMIQIPSGVLIRGGWDESWTIRLFRKYQDIDSDLAKQLLERMMVPPREVTLTTFDIDRFEVVNADYDKFVEDVATTTDGFSRWAHEEQPVGHDYQRMNATQTELNGPRNPVTGVNWYDAHAYCAWNGKRLPTEDEWEAAARGIGGWPYPWGRSFDETRYYSSNVGVGITTAIDRLTPPRPGAPIGMAGNVTEWTQSKSSDGEVIQKGGAWAMEPSDIFALAFLRNESSPSIVATNLGFRCADDAVDGDPTDSMIRVTGGVYPLGGEDSPLLALARRYENTNLDISFFFEDKPDQVTLDAYSISRYEVTNAEYRVFLDHVNEEGDTEYRHPDQSIDKDHTPAFWNDPDLNSAQQPVVGVDWFDAYAYANFAGSRLPSADEWEYAARGNTRNLYPWGNSFDPSKCVSLEGGAQRPVSVTTENEGSSPMGVFHMVGNAQEWTADEYVSTSTRIVMGGGWNERCEVFGLVHIRQVGAARDYRGRELGFRVARSVD